MGRGGESVWLVKKAFDCARIAVQFDQACNVDQAVLYYEKVRAVILWYLVVCVVFVSCLCCVISPCCGGFLMCCALFGWVCRRSVTSTR